MRDMFATSETIKYIVANEKSTLHRIAELVYYCDVVNDEDYIKILNNFIKNCSIRKWKKIRLDLSLECGNVKRWGHLLELTLDNCPGITFFNNKLHINNKVSKYSGNRLTLDYFIYLEKLLQEYFENEIIESFKSENDA